MWYVYIIRCKDKRFYTGITSNLERRLKEHKSGQGARFTKSFGFQKLVYQEGCVTRREALQREAQIKGWPRQKKLALITHDS